MGPAVSPAYVSRQLDPRKEVTTLKLRLRWLPGQRQLDEACEVRPREGVPWVYE